MIESRTGNMARGLLDLVKYIQERNDTTKLTLLEVGSYKGDSACIFAQYFGHVTCVDAWEQSLFNVPNTSAHAAEAEFDRRVARLSNVAKIKGRSLEVVVHTSTPVCDVLYIDASHDYESVKADLLAWRGKASLYVCGHDYWPSKFPGVVRAVNETLGKPDQTFCDMSFLWRVR